MPKSTLSALTNYLEELQLHGRPRPILLLGAGASKSAGLAQMDDLYVHVGLNPKDVDVREKFCDQISRKTASDRYALLGNYLQTVDPSQVTPGYRALADLCANRFFDLVLNANFDPLLDDALAVANLKRRHYVLLINGVIRPERMNLLLSQPEPRLKVIKLHGDLFYRQMAFTAAEMDDYLESIWPQLQAAVAGRDFLTVGYALKDRRITDLVLGAGGQIWYTNYSEHPKHLSPAERARLNEVVSKSCGFETFFPDLANRLKVNPSTATPPAEKKPTIAEVATPKPKRAKGGGKALRAATPSAARVTVPTATTVDDLLAALVGIWNPAYGFMSATGFLIAEPRVILIDGFVGDNFGGPITELVTSRGLHLPTRRVDRVTGDVFAPIILAAPKELQGPGLRIDATAVTAGLPIQIGVAVRHEMQNPVKPARKPRAVKQSKVAFGLSSGTVINGDEKQMDLSGYHCGHAIELACAVAPGSSGAPVVDETMAVRGFVIGGKVDIHHPLSVMFPASRWARELNQLQSQRRAS
ncbi:MAG TPA: SIR2 family protein [Pyrinomonadaceae bacterium]|nr:SIR2 family protein [Pyrinomonadaceae bacterium]